LLLTRIAMADDDNKIKKWIKKWQRDKGDIRAEKSPHITGPEEKLREAEPEEKLREAADRGDIRAEESPHITGPEEKLREAEKKLREEAAKVDEDEKSGDTMPPEDIVEHKPAEVKRHKDIPKIVEKGRVGINMLPHKPIVITLVIVAIVLGGFLLYSQMQLSNQSYKIENFNANWNQSLADLRSGNTTIVEYCNNRVHDEDLCNRFMNLQYMH
jgi:transposase-like protein